MAELTPLHPGDRTLPVSLERTKKPALWIGASMIDPAETHLRKNMGTWAVRPCQVPSVAHFMHDALPNEVFDPHFYGQAITTTYFDDKHYTLRKARIKGDQYVTLRVRCYKSPDTVETYALSAKTESEKFRIEINETQAYKLYDGKADWNDYLPPNISARLVGLAPSDIVPIVAIMCQRYSIEDDNDRFTLDVDIRTDLGKCMPYAVLEFKSTKDDSPPRALQAIGLYPIKLSKFLWATKP